jgi:hypothetical protein
MQKTLTLLKKMLISPGTKGLIQGKKEKIKLRIDQKSLALCIDFLPPHLPGTYQILVGMLFF